MFYHFGYVHHKENLNVERSWVCKGKGEGGGCKGNGEGGCKGKGEGRCNGEGEGGGGWVMGKGRCG